VKKLVLSGVLLSALCGVASAADVAVRQPYRPLPAPPPLPVFSWTGCYIGGNVGGAWARQDADTVGPANVLTDQAPVSVRLKGSSAIGGVHTGCNVQFAGLWVAGIEGDWSWTHLNDTVSAPNLFLNGSPVDSGNVTLSHDTKWLASLRGRLGVAVVPSVLLYGTGGAAWTRTNYTGFDQFITPCPNCVATEFSSSKTGWVAGAGAEWATWNNFLVRAEWLYYRFQGASGDAFFGPPFTPTLGATFNFHDLTINEFRVGLSYKFGGNYW
jgi:outer membrane immunogenic protein